MNKFSFLITAFCLFAGSRVLAQAKPVNDENKDKQEAVEAKKKAQPINDNQEKVKEEDTRTTTIKAVPPARDKNVKPARVNSAKARIARPEGSRPARSARPSSRPVRPGNRRN
jgi:hypothetical protein